MNLHRAVIDQRDRIEEVLFTWIWTELESRLNSNPDSVPYVTGDDILSSARYELLSRKIQKDIIRAWDKFQAEDTMYHDKSLSSDYKWIGRPRLKKWRLSAFDEYVLKQY